MTIQAFPLAWPAGKPRTARHLIERSRFEPGNRPSEVANVQAELSRLGARKVVVSTNVRLRLDGVPYANDKAPTDQGVAVYFDYAGGQKCFACDRWKSVEENLRAIAKSIEAIRGLERWGSKSFVDAAFTGFSALPSPSAARAWWEVLGLPQSASVEEISRAYRTKAMEIHKSGSGDNAMSELNVARDEGLRARS